VTTRSRLSFAVSAPACRPIFRSADRSEAPARKNRAELLECREASTRRSLRGVCEWHGHPRDAAQLVAFAVLLAVMGYCVWTQRAEGRILNVVTGPAALVAAVSAPLIWDGWPLDLAAGAISAVAAGLLVGAWLGMGTVKLFAVAAIAMGPAAWPAALVTAATTAAQALWRRGRGESLDMPPHLLAGVLAALVVASATAATPASTATSSSTTSRSPTCSSRARTSTSSSARRSA
jgi:hypothetical protein